MVTGLYAALASAASVFIGILAALLASNLANLSTQRERVEKRIEAIDARLENLDTQYQQFREEMEEIREEEEAIEARQTAEDDVDSFIDSYVGSEWNPDADSVSKTEMEAALRGFLNEAPNEYHYEELERRIDDVRDELEPTGLMGPTPSIPPDAAIIASNNQIEHEWKIHRNQRFNRAYRRWIQTMTEIRSLQGERTKLVNRHESLDPRQYRNTLAAVAAPIVFSVGVPLLFYFFRAIDRTILQLQPWVEPTIVGASWVIGLFVVLYHLWQEVSEDRIELPESPDTELDGDTEGNLPAE
ncbi:hypothetical protein [Halobaculum magnesiiphilum]|uniref:Uncharacterized protein n=1 Tax=Halobaculum magnesiiphilum TaxID=1017351 RepID=A0A8T8WFM2_9EURY|nr:hypothetical protein [Halobaculum magnesiiphilum]QZP38544.1 hypothetical protein K6T50_05225 [Halobaculum magnesiiphilum]